MMGDVLPFAKTSSRRLVPWRNGERPRSPTHIEWVRTLPCVVMGAPVGVVAHHLLGGDPSAMSSRSGDDWAIPLVNQLHDAQHHWALHAVPGREMEWWKDMGVDPLVICRRLWAISIVAGRVRVGEVERREAAELAGADWLDWTGTWYGQPPQRGQRRWSWQR